MDALKATVEKESLDCELLVRRSFDVFFDEEHAKTIKTWLKEEREAGMAWTRNVQWLEGENLEKVSGYQLHTTCN